MKKSPSPSFLLSPSPSTAVGLCTSECRGVLGKVRILLATPPPPPPPTLSPFPSATQKGAMDRQYLDSLYTVPALRYHLKTSKKRGETKGITPPPLRPSNESVVDKRRMNDDGLVPPMYVVFWPSLRQAI